MTLRQELASRVVAEPAGPLTPESIETNTTLVGPRGEPNMRIAMERLAVTSLKGLRLLDLGCGYGGLSALYAHHGATVTAVDPNTARLGVLQRVADQHHLNIRVVTGKMPELDFPDTSFDAVVMNNSLCYVIEHDARLTALAQAHRVLIDGGVLIMLNPNLWYPTTFTRAILRLKPDSRFFLQSPTDARRELAAAGFVDVQHHPSAGRAPKALRIFARYTHLSARRTNPDHAAG